MTRKLSAAGAAAVMLLLAGTAAAQQQDDGKEAGDYNASVSGESAQGMPMMPDVSGIQQQMQAQMMQQMMAGQMQSASPAAQMMPGAAQQTVPAPGQAAQGMMPDVSGIQQRMQAQMMQQMMAGQMQSASPAAQMMPGAEQQPAPAPGQAAQGGTMMMPPADPSSMMRQNMQLQLQNVLGLAPAAAQPEQGGGFQIDSAISSIKMDSAVQTTINEKMMKIMEQTMRETFADPKMRQEMQQRFLGNGIAPGSGQAKQP